MQRNCQITQELGTGRSNDNYIKTFVRIDHCMQHNCQINKDDHVKTFKLLLYFFETWNRGDWQNKLNLNYKQTKKKMIITLKLLSD